MAESVQAASDVIVDVKWIADRLEDGNVRVVEIDVSPAAYNGGHILGAALWNAYADLRDDSYKPVGRAQLEKLLSRSGITSDSTVVVYGYSAPLGFWLLKAYGHNDVRMLAGARDQWGEAGKKWSTDVLQHARTAYKLQPEDATASASLEDVRAAMNDSEQLVVDVRSELEYSGERFWPSGASEDTGRSGHVPGAISVPIDLLCTDGGILKSPEELRRIFEGAGVTGDKGVITYCTIGNRASQAWFALKYLLNYPDVRVYYGSWVEWGKLSAPIER